MRFKGAAVFFLIARSCFGFESQETEEEKGKDRADSFALSIE